MVPLSRGTIAPPGSEAISRAKGSRWNLGGPAASTGIVTGGGSQQGMTGADCSDGYTILTDLLREIRPGEVSPFELVEFRREVWPLDVMRASLAAPQCTSLFIHRLAGLRG